MGRREPPQTAEGWYVLHDLRTIDWDAWRSAPERERKRAIEDGIEYLTAHEAVEDAEAGDSAVFSVLGHEADLLFIHLRPSMAHLDTAERRFEQTAFARFTDQTDSYISVTEVSGYMSQEYFDGEEIEDTGTARYIESRLKPEIPDAAHVSFYPMDKRRDPEYNWYDLPFDERADLMSGHGDIGRGYAGKVTQIITGSVGFDDHEWGVTLFADDPAQIKKLLYEMRFDPSSSRYAEFASFHFGRRFSPTDLGALLAGDPIPTDDAGQSHTHGESTHHDNHASGGHAGDESSGDIRDALADEDIYAGQPHGEDVHAMVLYSEADPEDLADDVSGLRGNFEHYDTHVKTAVYENHEARNASERASSAERSSADHSSGQSPREDEEERPASADGGNAAVVSIWETQSAAETAGGFLSDLPGIVARAQVGEGESGFGTMGMFYTTKPEHRADFVERFDTVRDLLADMDGHSETDLLVNRTNENDMFIASQWRSREDAMEFFRSEEFRETVSWGREVLADRPRHVFFS